RQTRKAGLLKQQYRSIERLNDAWGKAWTDFDPIHPAATGADYVEMFLRWQWAAFAVAEQARFVSETIRAAAR
ncbi:MAG: hypothetical protein HY360_07280, partial [Verrucomicrobia bacterium]|nr:hypothetical protein [Verrucomicrobiota bacterium]